MAWSKIGESEYIIQNLSNEKLSVIAAKSDNDIECLAISKSNTNREVFLEFMQMLISSIKNKYGDKYRKLILTCDGSKYHLVKEINNYLIQEEMMMLKIIPYTPEFAAIEIFINCIKNKIRKKLALTK